jgi:hypothetical protein
LNLRLHSQAGDNGGAFLIHHDVLGPAKIFETDRFEPDAKIVGDALPPVRMAMSSIVDLRRSPKPGDLTAQTLMVLRSLFTTRVVSASPSISSAMINIGLPAGRSSRELGTTL